MNKTILVSAMGLTLGLGGCAHRSVEKRLDEKVSQESGIKNRSDLSDETTRLIQSSLDLSAEQKAKLLALRDSTRDQNMALSDQSLKLKAVLVRDLLSPDYDKKEVALIKKKIRDIENKRVTNLFDSVEQANTILGRQVATNQDIVRQFAQPRSPRAY